MVFECFQGEIELNGDNLQISETSSHSKDNIPKCFGKFDHFFLVWAYTELTDSLQNTKTITIIKIPELKIYFASDCISWAGHSGGEDSLCFFFNRNVSSNPKPLGPSSPLQNTNTKYKCQ